MSAKAGSIPVLGDKHWWQILVRGIIALIFGIVVLAWPTAALIIFALLFGAFVFVDGIFTLVAAINYKAGSGRRVWLYVAGIAGILVGLVIFLLPVVAIPMLILILVYLIAAWALVTGVMELVYAFQANQDTAIRWMFAISGILSIILGILMLLKPLIGALVIAVVVGAYAVLAGILLIILSFRLRSIKA
ncbi:MAG TPA: DUF308 domain-containing protein [Dehalococcoidia bacterium]|jgi:uncharacterized membrane protein HdeD (DUF308 family)